MLLVLLLDQLTLKTGRDVLDGEYIWNESLLFDIPNGFQVEPPIIQPFEG